MEKNDALQRIKRFYKQAEARPAAGGFAVVLDGRQPKTPGGAALIVPTEAAARMVAEEWAAQDKWIDFSAMAATRHAFTAIDRVRQHRAETAGEVARFAASDLLCYFAREPKALVV